MDDYMQQKEKIANLLSKFFEDTLTPEEKRDLYHYIMNDNHKNEVMVWLQEQWAKELWHADEITGETLFAKIKEKIGVDQTITSPVGRKIPLSQSKTEFTNSMSIKNQKWKIFLRYAAVFVIAFGLSWTVQKMMTGTVYVPVVAETVPQYNEILVPYGSKTKVILPDNSSVWLNAGARLKYPAHFDGDMREVYLQGEGFFDITKDSQHPFIVNSNGVNIKVLGTKFNLMANADDNTIEATLVEGTIEVLGLKDTKSEGDGNLTLKPGQKLTLQKEKNSYRIVEKEEQEAALLIPKIVAEPVKIKSANLSDKADVEQTTAWTENKMVFEKERFEMVKTRLERWYGVSIEVRNPEILDYRFTGTFDKETFEQAMSALSKAALCDFKIDKSQVIVTKK